MSDGGGIFRCNQALDVYAALEIKKEQIEKRQAWQNYIESHFNIARKMVDAKFARATSWGEALAIHRRFMRDYNVQRHWAHENREDGRHSPTQVLGWYKGTVYSTEFLDRILFATRYTRHLDKNGYLRFQNWKLYGERGLAKAPVTVWIYEGSLKVEHQAVTLSKYAVSMQDDHKHVHEVNHPHLTETPFRSPQLALFDLGPGDWLLYWRTPDTAPARRKRRVEGMVQLPLLPLVREEKAVGETLANSATHPLAHLHLVTKRASDQDVEE